MAVPARNPRFRAPLPIFCWNWPQRPTNDGFGPGEAAGDFQLDLHRSSVILKVTQQGAAKLQILTNARKVFDDFLNFVRQHYEVSASDGGRWHFEGHGKSVAESLGDFLE